MQFSYPIPTKFRIGDDDAGVIHTFLESKGLVVSGVSINEIDRIITIDADRDPLNDLKTFDPPLSPKQKAAAALQDLNAIDLDAATVAQLRTALKLVRGLINYEVRTP